MSENKRVTIPFLAKVLKPIVELINKKADKSDIPEVVQSDWDETDETNLAFIKNKPDENDAIELVAEFGLIDPVADENGAIYTDKNGEILTL